MTRPARSYSSDRQDAIVCAPTREEHDILVGIRGRSFTDSGIRPHSLDMPVAEAVSIIDTYVAEYQRATR